MPRAAENLHASSAQEGANTPIEPEIKAFHSELLLKTIPCTFRENLNQTNELAGWNTASSTNTSATKHLGPFYHNGWVDAGHPTVAHFKVNRRWNQSPVAPLNLWLSLLNILFC